MTCAVKTVLPEATEAEPEPEAKAAPGRQERTAAMDIPVEMAAC